MTSQRLIAYISHLRRTFKDRGYSFKRTHEIETKLGYSLVKKKLVFCEQDENHFYFLNNGSTIRLPKEVMQSDDQMTIIFRNFLDRKLENEIITCDVCSNDVGDYLIGCQICGKNICRPCTDLLTEKDGYVVNMEKRTMSIKCYQTECQGILGTMNMDDGPQDFIATYLKNKHNIDYIPVSS